MNLMLYMELVNTFGSPEEGSVVPRPAKSLWALNDPYPNEPSRRFLSAPLASNAGSFSTRPP